MLAANDGGSGPDLDLLRCFAALHREHHLSRAAARRGLSQPAMSRALARLRAAFGDPLFVRVPRGMVPTARADELAPQVRAVLDAAGALVRPAAFDPRALVRAFAIGCADVFDAGFIPRLIAILERAAPGVDLSIRPLEGDVGGALADGRLDVMIGVRESVPGDARMHKLYDEHFLCAVRRDHPSVGRRISLDKFVALPHLQIAPRGNPGGIVDTALAALGRARRVVARTHTFLSAPAIVASTDLILTAPSRVLTPLAGPFRLKLLAPPLEVPTFATMLAWHPRSQDDPAHAWFRSQIAAASRQPAA